MTKIDIFSGFLGAGKTTLIKKLIEEAYKGEKVVLIENEFGEIGIDGGFLKEAGVQINEMNSGCICCSLVGDFSAALKKVINEYSPDRVIIEPSGVGKLSDVILAVEEARLSDAVLNGFTTVVDVNKCNMYIKNFGEFFLNQVEHAATIVLSHTGGADEKKIKACVDLLKEHNGKALIVTTDWKELTGKQLLDAIERKNTLEDVLHELHHIDECPCCHEHHHHHDECDHEHRHEHHHDHHEHGEECECSCHHEHHHHEHHHHHADEVFTSFGRETAKRFTLEAIKTALDALCDENRFGAVLRAKGIVESEDGGWIHFDYIPGESDVRYGSADITGRLCVIGAELHEQEISELFGL